MLVEYETITYLRRGNGTATQQDPIGYWIASNLRNGGIEAQITKLQNLLAIIGEQLLIDHPEKVIEVANAIDCEGARHKIARYES